MLSSTLSSLMLNLVAAGTHTLCIAEPVHTNTTLGGLGHSTTDGTSLGDRTSPCEKLPIKPVDHMNVELTPPSLIFGESLFEFISLSTHMLTLIQVVDPQFLKRCRKYSELKSHSIRTTEKLNMQWIKIMYPVCLAICIRLCRS